MASNIFVFVDRNGQLAHCDLDVRFTAEGYTVILTGRRDNPGMAMQRCISDVATQVWHHRLHADAPALIRWFVNEGDASIHEITFGREPVLDLEKDVWRGVFEVPMWGVAERSVGDLESSTG